MYTEQYGDLTDEELYILYNNNYIPLSEIGKDPYIKITNNNYVLLEKIIQRVYRIENENDNKYFLTETEYNELLDNPYHEVKNHDDDDNDDNDEPYYLEDNIYSNLIFNL